MAPKGDLLFALHMCFFISRYVVFHETIFPYKQSNSTIYVIPIATDDSNNSNVI